MNKEQSIIPPGSMLRPIWGSTDITLFIFAGAAAEFALNKEVDWLYFTGRLPSDPIGRLFSTVSYAQRIIFSENQESAFTIEEINRAHAGVEKARGFNIGEEAYHEVLFMLIYYSMACFELLNRKLTLEEKDEIVHSFAQIGARMHLQDLPDNYASFQKTYGHHLDTRLERSHLTTDLYRQYRKHLGAFRYFVLLEVQRLIVSEPVNRILRLGKPRVAGLVLPIYKGLRRLGLHRPFMYVMIPKKFLPQFKEMAKRNDLSTIK